MAWERGGVLLIFLLGILTHRVICYDNGVPSLGGTPPMGWNTWCTGVPECAAPDYCNQAEVMGIADALVSSGMAELGYRFVNLDDCWSAEKRAADGQLQANANRFPNGMPWLIDYVHSKGLYMGLYTCVGTATCRGGRPGSYGHYEQDAATLASWGVDFVKADNCAHPANSNTQDLYTNFSSALNATGRTMLFSLCEWGTYNVEQWGGSVGQMYRVQMDHLPFWDWTSPLPLAEGEGTGQGVVNIIDYMATLTPSKWVRPYAWMDPDFLETLMPIYLPFIESRTEFTFWSMWSAPLIVATNIRNMTAEKKSILMNAEAIAVDQDPLARGGDRVWFDNTTHAQVWSKQMANNRAAFVLFNPRSKLPLNITATWDMLGYASSQPLKLRDIWEHQDLGIFTSSFTATVALHDVAFIQATPAS